SAAAYANSSPSLFKKSASGGEPVRLTSGGDSFSRPVFRPDGKALYAIFETQTDKKVYHLERLARIEVRTGSDSDRVTATPILTNKWDRSVGSAAFSPRHKTD